MMPDSYDVNSAGTSSNSAYNFWRNTLRNPKYIVAPMVDQSELAWRLLCRRHGAQLCYTPMFHAQNFVNDPIYRRDNFKTCSEDRPLVVQFCSNDPETFVKACRLVENDCDAVDLNLGCPQSIAKRGHYGAFLQDEWDLIKRLVSSASEVCKVPICCKIRVFDDLQRSVQYAQMLEKSGCQMLAVHGRTRDQKGRQTSVADWSKIKAIKQAVSIPVVSNGNIQYPEDVYKCLRETNVDGVMSAEGNLHNPFIFETRQDVAACWQPAFEYLELVDKYPCSMTYVRGHLFKLFHFSMLQFPDLRERLATSTTVQECRSVTEQLQNRCQERHSKYLEKLKQGPVDTSCDLEYFWLCRPYVRPSEVDNPATTENNSEPETNSKRQILAIKRKHQQEVERLSEKYGLSKNKAKKLMRYPTKNLPSAESLDQLSKKPAYKCSCGNPLSPKCAFKLCKLCCRAKFGLQSSDCQVHRSQRFRQSTVQVET